MRIPWTLATLFVVSSFVVRAQPPQVAFHLSGESANTYWGADREFHSGAQPKITVSGPLNSWVGVAMRVVLVVPPGATVGDQYRSHYSWLDSETVNARDWVVDGQGNPVGAGLHMDDASRQALVAAGNQVPPLKILPSSFAANMLGEAVGGMDPNHQPIRRLGLFVGTSAVAGFDKGNSLWLTQEYRGWFQGNGHDLWGGVAGQSNLEFDVTSLFDAVMARQWTLAHGLTYPDQVDPQLIANIRRDLSAPEIAPAYPALIAQPISITNGSGGATSSGLSIATPPMVQIGAPVTLTVPLFGTSEALDGVIVIRTPDPTGDTPEWLWFPGKAGQLMHIRLPDGYTGPSNLTALFPQQGGAGVATAPITLDTTHPTWVLGHLTVPNNAILGDCLIVDQAYNVYGMHPSYEQFLFGSPGITGFRYVPDPSVPPQTPIY